MTQDQLISKDYDLGGEMRRGKFVVIDAIKVYNSFNIVDSDWVNNSDGYDYLVKNKSAKKTMVPLTGLKTGDVLKSFQLTGGVGGASVGKTTVVDAALYKAVGANGGVTTTSLGAITQITVNADDTFDSANAAKTLATEVTIADETQYFVLVTGTTANYDECDIRLSGVKVTMNTSG